VTQSRRVDQEPDADLRLTVLTGLVAELHPRLHGELVNDVDVETEVGERPVAGIVGRAEPELGRCAEPFARPGHLDTFRASDNFFWLEAGEEHAITVIEPDGLTVDAWNAPIVGDRGTED
jgi:hypothetical protein